MLRSLKAVQGYSIHATDGEIGKVHDFYFHDDTWLIRYLVVDTGHWLTGRRVLIPPHALGEPRWDDRSLPVGLTREQVENSPNIDTDQPVSRQQESELYQHYGWPAYWVDPGMGPWPSIMPMIPIPPPARPAAAGKLDPHLRSMKQVRGYHIHATDGEIGHVADFVADDALWVIRYLVLDTRNWLPGKQVLVSPQWLRDISDWEHGVHVDLTRETIRSSPEFDPVAPVNREYEVRLYDYYGRPGYWSEEEGGKRAAA